MGGGCPLITVCSLIRSNTVCLLAQKSNYCSSIFLVNVTIAAEDVLFVQYYCGITVSGEKKYDEFLV